MRRARRIACAALAAAATLPSPLTRAAVAQERDERPEVRFQVNLPRDDARTTRLKAEAARLVDSMSTLTQQMVDMLFSFSELGFHEVETERYLTGILEQQGFRIERGYAGMPTAWVARWGSGRPVISLGSDIDGIPQASQRPGVAYRAPLVEGAPGHGEGHNSGVPANITAAIALKRIMERDRIPGTIVLWPGVAEEQLGAKAHFVRAGLFRDADVVIFSHVGSNWDANWGSPDATGIVSVEYTFEGTTAHSAGSPWRGRSALDAVELMNIGWNFRREHLRLQHRSHYVITDGGDQPNVVPRRATVWYYFRELDYARLRELWALGDTIANAAAQMTGTRLVSTRVLGSAWPQYFNKPLSLAMQENIRAVGMPRWSEADQQLARALQREIGATVRGLDTVPDTPRAAPLRDSDKRGGGSDDIGDVSWSAPTVRLYYPANIPNLPGHNWANAVAMATPIAHKGATAAAKVMAMSMVDYFLKPTLVTQAADFFRNVQTRELKYESLMRADDRPATWLNQRIMEQYKPQLRQYYYDPARYRTYLDQLGITYPTVRQP